MFACHGVLISTQILTVDCALLSNRLHFACMSTLPENIRQELHTFFAQQEAITLAYLFGSFAEGRAHVASDVDIAILCETPLTFHQYDALQTQIQLIVKRPVDLVLLDNVPLDFQYAVLASGQCLYERDRATRVEYEAKVAGLYQDALVMLKHLHQDISEGASHERAVEQYRKTLERTRRTLATLGKSARKQSE
ncbi:MAG: nucleotidyltransferase domain-containing protein [Ardenticatenia bacterium]|nr:MAG: nucleotidyltransferase domain-containing protein [Ardenticatenia bacterium]